MLEISQYKGKYPTKELKELKDSLTKRMNNAYKTNEDMSKLSSELATVTTKHQLFKEFSYLVRNYEQAEAAFEEGDEEMKELATLELEELEPKIVTKDEEITKYLVAEELSDEDDMKSVIVEIRAGAGGDEASLFAGDLFRMYKSFANTKNWKIELLETSSSEAGGFKELIGKIEGENVYKHLKYESGVHRVQRIPETESGGRIHTSTASVAILPEAEDVDIQINNEDLRIDTMRSSGAGGQSVNKTDSAIRITHLPTGLVVSCQDTKVQQQNRERAMQILRSRLYELEKQKKMEERSEMRSSQIGQAMRSEKIRTYNYPQSRITDHRVKKSWFNLEEIMNGTIEEMLNDLNDEFVAMQLEEMDFGSAPSDEDSQTDPKS